MSQYLTNDRRRKPDGEHLEYPVRLRFKGDEMDELSAAAQLETEGRLAPYLRELVLEAHEVRKQRRAQLLADLAEGKPLDDQARQALADLMARMAERSLMKNMTQQLMA